MLKVQVTKKLWHFNLDLELNLENHILVLWGHSGAGKTTFLHCLAGLTNPSSGLIQLDGHTLYSSEKKINLPTRLRNVGYLFQDYALFPNMTVRQNVMYGPKNQKRRLKAENKIKPLALLDTFGVDHLIDRYPSQLSGGEKQRVALARALAVQPKLLLLDEPFSALDKNTKTTLRQEIKEIHKLWQIPFILVTHDEEDAAFLGERILTLHKGLPTENNLAHFA